ncbi:MAG: hypothetical protein WAT93_02045 [Pontixanthobacter sp.]
MRYGAVILASTLVTSCGDVGGPDRSSGVWIGDLKLCAETVKRVSDGFDEVRGLPLVAIRFRPEAGKRIAEMTSALVGQRLEVTINGSVISAPTVAEPVTGGEIQLLALPDGAYADIDAYAKIPC